MNASRTIRNGVCTWDYENRYSSVALPANGGTVQYSYDAVGNRVTMVSGSATTGYNVNNLDQYTSVGGTTYGYDADGNLTSSGTWTYSYDDENRLIAVSGPGGKWNYQYDALGNRMAQINGSTATQYLTDPTGIGQVVAEFNGGGNLVNHFTYGLGLTSSLPASGSAQFYQFDGSSNTVAVTGTGGAVLDTYRYLPFGEKVVTGSVPNPFTYAGQLGVSDDGDGLYYMRARYYSPTIGRFISEDPIGFDGGDNFYSYVRNNPADLTDPLGLAPNGTHVCGDYMCDGSGKPVGLAPPEVRGLSEDTTFEFSIIGAAYEGVGALLEPFKGLNDNPLLRIGPGYGPGGRYLPIRIASGGRWGRGGCKLPWHWHMP